MRLRNLDLIIVMVVVAINIAWTQVPGHLIFVGIVLALPLILGLPGYTLTQVLFRRRNTAPAPEVANSAASSAGLKVGHPIGRSDQVVLSLGLSMAIDVLVGFALNILPIGLTGLSWVVSLGLITLVFAVLAVLFRRKDTLKVTTQPRLRITVQDCLLLGLAAIVVASAIWLAIIRPLQPQPSFTQLWMLPANQASKTCAVSVGVQNFETGPETYQVVILVNNAQTNNWSPVTLDPQQKWVQEVALKPGVVTGDTLYIEARLYKTEQPDAVYRNVHLTFYISSSNINGVLQQQCVSGTQG